MYKLKLYHYSNRDFKGYIKPSFFGFNNHSGNSERISQVKRSFFYLKANQKEYYFNGIKFLYIAEIIKNKLYNIDKDPKKILNKLNCRSDIYQAIKKKGYLGIIGNNGYNIACLFNPIKIKAKEVLS